MPKTPKPLLVVIPQAQVPLLYAACAAIGSKPQDLVPPALRLFCTYILNEWTPAVRKIVNRKGVKPTCEPHEIVAMLASRFASRTRPAKTSPKPPRPKA